MEVLCRTVDATLQGANLETEFSAKWTAMCREGFKAAGDVALWSTYTNQPFSPPPLRDIGSIITTAQLRLDVIGDHLAVLQTDPSYLRHYIRTGSQGEAYKSGALADTFGMLDSDIAADAVSLYWWLCIKEEAEHVKDVQQRFRDQIHRGSALPPKCNRALAALELVLVNVMNIEGLMYSREIQQRPGSARYFRFEAIPGGKLQVSQGDRTPMANKPRDDPLFWCLMNLCGKPDVPSGFGHDHLFRLLEDHLASAPLAEKARLDQIIIDHLSAHAANYQMLLAVRLHRPQNEAGDTFEFNKTEKRKAWGKDLLLGDLIEGGHHERGLLLKRFYQIPPPSGRKDAA